MGAWGAEMRKSIDKRGNCGSFSVSIPALGLGFHRMRQCRFPHIRPSLAREKRDYYDPIADEMGLDVQRPIVIGFNVA